MGLSKKLGVLLGNTKCVPLLLMKTFLTNILSKSNPNKALKIYGIRCEQTGNILARQDI